MIQSLLIIKEVIQMSIKDSLSELPENELKKIMLKKFLEQEIDTSDEVYQKSFEGVYLVYFRYQAEYGHRYRA